MLARYRAWLLPALFAVMLLKPPLMVWIEGRDLEALYYDMTHASGYRAVTNLVGRSGTALALALAGLAIFAWLTGAGRYRSRRINPRVLRLPVGLLLLATSIYFLGSVAAPAWVNAGVEAGWRPAYVLAVVAAMWFGRKLPRRPVLAAVQWSIAAVLVLSLALAPLRPELTMGWAGAEQRLSFAAYRFWGLGSGPNSIAPLAVVQLMLQLYQPMRRSPVWLLANVVAAIAAIVVIVWAQSQTTWAVAVLVLPFLLIRRTMPRRMSATRMKATTMVVLLIGVLAAGGLVGGELVRSGALTSIADALPLQKSGIWDHGGVAAVTTIGDELLTGRGRVWTTAIDVWQDNPWFGYGLGAWDTEFRRFFGLPSALHAHNQFLQALSVGGIVGLASLVCYLAALGYFGWRTSGLSRGLTLGLLSLVSIRMLTEVPLELRSIEDADATVHLLLLYLLFAYGTRWQGRRKVGWADGASRASRRRRRARTGIAPSPAPGVLSAVAVPSAGSAAGGAIRAPIVFLGSRRREPVRLQPAALSRIGAAASESAPAEALPDGPDPAASNVATSHAPPEPALMGDSHLTSNPASWTESTHSQSNGQSHGKEDSQ